MLYTLYSHLISMSRVSLEWILSRLVDKEAEILKSHPSEILKTFSHRASKQRRQKKNAGSSGSRAHALATIPGFFLPGSRLLSFTCLLTHTGASTHRSEDSQPF